MGGQSVSDDLLLDVECKEPADVLRGVAYRWDLLAVRCEACKACFNHIDTFSRSCPLCGANDLHLSSMPWHEYVQDLVERTDSYKEQARRLAADLLAEHRKLCHYVHLMRDREEFDAAEKVNTANRRAKQIVQDFEEALWEGSL
jgi:hypothetical protein